MSDGRHRVWCSRTVKGMCADDFITVPKRITFGDDRSAGADIAWGWITTQQWQDWDVDVVRVTDPDPRIEALFSYDPLHEDDRVDQRVAPGSSGIAKVRHLTTAHDPRIILYTKRDSRLTVVGARGRGLLKSMRIGSTAEWLMRCPGTPLVVARASSPVYRIVVCVDGSAHAQVCVQTLCDLPWIAGREVVVLTVLDEMTGSAEAASDAAKALTSVGATTQVVVVNDEAPGAVLNAARVIVDRIDALQPDMVALGTRGMTGFTRLAIGSVAGAVVHASSCSVLLTRDQDEQSAVAVDG